MKKSNLPFAASQDSSSGSPQPASLATALRKGFVIPALATLLLTGACSDDNISPVTPTDNSDLITLCVTPDLWSTELATRAASTSQATMHSLGVLACHTPVNWATNGTATRPDLLFNLEAINPGTAGVSWPYGTLRPWPATGRVTFFAYSPYASTNGSNGIKMIDNARNPVTGPTYPGIPLLEFEVNTDPVKQVDLLLSDFDNTKDKVKTDGRINFLMRHALTRVAFRVRKSPDLTETVKVTRIVLVNAVQKGIFRMCSFDPATTTGNGTNQSNDFRTYRNTRADFAVEPSGGPVTITATTASTPAVYTPVTGIGGTSADFLMMLPQNIDDSSVTGGVTTPTPATEKVKLHIEYTLGTSPNVLVRELDLSTLPDHKWLGGTAITYNATLGVASFTVESSVTDWDDQNVTVDAPATYLNVSQIVVNSVAGNTVTIYYSTDGSPVKGSYNGGAETLLLSTPGNGTYTFTAVSGITKATISSGGLKRVITVNAVAP